MLSTGNPRGEGGIAVQPKTPTLTRRDPKGGSRKKPKKMRRAADLPGSTRIRRKNKPRRQEKKKEINRACALMNGCEEKERQFVLEDIRRTRARQKSIE